MLSLRLYAPDICQRRIDTSSPYTQCRLSAAINPRNGLHGSPIDATTLIPDQKANLKPLVGGRWLSGKVRMSFLD
jgi:hypothetical protein